MQLVLVMCALGFHMELQFTVGNIQALAANVHQMCVAYRFAV